MLRKIDIISFVILSLFFSVLNGTVYGSGQDNRMVHAIQLFDEGEFLEAERAFEVLLEESSDPILLYYYGAVRTENGYFGDVELERLLLSGKTFTADRLYYYLGIQYHAREEWDIALKYYNYFKASVPIDEQQELKIAEKIQFCYDHNNPYISSKDEVKVSADENIIDANLFSDPEEDDKPEALTTTADTTYSTKYLSEDNPLSIDQEEEIIKFEEGGDDDVLGSLIDDGNTNIEKLPDLPGVKSTFKLPDGGRITFRVNETIIYYFNSQFRTGEGLELFIKGSEKQDDRKSLEEEMEVLRRNYRTLAGEEKSNAGERILMLEQDIYLLKREIDDLLSKARSVENEWWESADDMAVKNFLTDQKKIEAILWDKDGAEGIDKERSEEPDILSADLLPVFVDPKIERVGEHSGQLVYKIQIGAYSRGIPSYRKRIFENLQLLRTIESYTDENGVVVYITGNLSTLDDANLMLSQVRQEGIKDAVIAAYYNGKRISLEDAKNIEEGGGL